MPQSAGYVSPEYLRKSAELAGKLKQYSYELMRISPGNRILDLGCGPGIDTVALAKLVGDAGKVYGLDVDEIMVSQADEFALKENVANRIIHQTGDVKKLPFENDFFDAVRAERLFQVLPENYSPQQVFSEILRITKPGGRIVLADTDWATASVDFPDSELERRLLSFFARSMRPNGFAGRQFYKLFFDNSVKDINIDTFPLVLNDFSLTPFGKWLTDAALKKTIATASEIENWMDTLNKEHEAGRFYASVNMNVVSGVKP